MDRKSKEKESWAWPILNHHKAGIGHDERSNNLHNDGVEMIKDERDPVRRGFSATASVDASPENFG